MNCYKCEKELQLEANQHISRQEECSYCYASLRCCKMCNFYDSNAYNECKEPMSDRILEKEKANFCDYFTLGNTLQDQQSKKEDALAAAMALFKK